PCPTICATLTDFSLLLPCSPASTHIYTLSLHDALPISVTLCKNNVAMALDEASDRLFVACRTSQISVLDTLTGKEVTSFPITKGDRKSTRLNSSHGSISYAVFCLKKKIIK